MNITPHQVRFLENVASAGIEFKVNHWALREFELQPDQIEAYAQDPDLFAANQFGVTKEHLLAWGQFTNGYQCIALTAKKKQCKAAASAGYDVDEPTLFSTTNPDCYCKMHAPQNETPRSPTPT